MASLLPELLFEISGQAASPSKDFYHLAVIWRWWKISLPMKQKALPGERKNNEFLNVDKLQQHIIAVFGSKILEYSLGLCEGRFDYLERLIYELCTADKLLLHVLYYLSYQDICHLNQTSHLFKKLCQSKELWEQAMWHSGNELTPEIEMMANMCGWRRISLYHSTAQHYSEADINVHMNENKNKAEPHEYL
ncbi:hypothetical protein Q7C36_009894 [Tachysurus vachellii]|uniref:F-box domain-containing protein n=1 Tax=Tachysurus vachellii TaxID=175792 RepID=A0AA88N035_TACVA|nr:hypothetical protein Q7C36_009894 [Tachysurus vachellii]